MSVSHIKRMISMNFEYFFMENGLYKHGCSFFFFRFEFKLCNLSSPHPNLVYFGFHGSRLRIKIKMLLATNSRDSDLTRKLRPGPIMVVLQFYSKSRVDGCCIDIKL